VYLQVYLGLQPPPHTVFVGGGGGLHNLWPPHRPRVGQPGQLSLWWLPFEMETRESSLKIWPWRYSDCLKFVMRQSRFILLP
jgi:hypothetical protein